MLGIAAAAVGAVAIALVSQHVFDMQPCPWCILQRVIYLVIALIAVVGAFLPAGAARRGAGLLIAAFAIGGIASAVYQHQVASALASCNLTFADTVITTLGLEELLPPVFQVTASCADAAVKVAGLPYEVWSLMLYVVLGLSALMLTGRAAVTKPAA